MEMVVYIGIVAVVLSTIFSLFMWILQLERKSRAIQELSFYTQNALRLITEEVQQADSFYTPTTNNSQLSLETANDAPEGEVYTYVDFYVCFSQLCIKKEGQDPISLFPPNLEVQTLSFSQAGTSMQIYLEARFKNEANKPELEEAITLQTAAALRPK